MLDENPADDMDRDGRREWIQHFADEQLNFSVLLIARIPSACFEH